MHAAAKTETALPEQVADGDETEVVGADALPPDALDCILSSLPRSDLRRAFSLASGWRAAAKRVLESKAWRRAHAYLRVMRLPRTEQALSNCVYLHPDDLACPEGGRLYLRVGGHILVADGCADVPRGFIALNAYQRTYTSLGEGAASRPAAITARAVAAIPSIQKLHLYAQLLRVDHEGEDAAEGPAGVQDGGQAGAPPVIDCKEMVRAALAAFDGHVLRYGMRLAVRVPGLRTSPRDLSAETGGEGGCGESHHWLSLHLDGGCSEQLRGGADGMLRAGVTEITVGLRFGSLLDVELVGAK